MVTKDDACWIIGLSAGAGIGVYLDGGWGVDALVGRETRAHNDIDLFVQRGDYQRFVDLIADEGFSEVAASFTTEDHTVWQDEAGRIVDLHCFDFAENGDILYQGDRFPGEVCSGRSFRGGGASARWRCRASTPKASCCFTWAISMTSTTSTMSCSYAVSTVSTFPKNIASCCFLHRVTTSALAADALRQTALDITPRRIWPSAHASPISPA